MEELKNETTQQVSVNEQKHAEAVKQKEIDSQQLLEYMKFNTMSQNSILETELTNVLNNPELTESAKRDIARCIQISRGYTEYKVMSIAEATGFNRTRTKTLIQYLISVGKVEIESFENTTFLKLLED